MADEDADEEAVPVEPNPEDIDAEAETPPEEAGDETAETESGGGLSERAAVLISAVVGVVVAVLSVWWASGFDVFYETLFRIQPTLEGGGVGADFVAGNTDPVLKALITIIHLADVVLGLFILLLVFIHWGAFRRLAARMQPPDGGRIDDEDVAADGGRDVQGGESR